MEGETLVMHASTRMRRSPWAMAGLGFAIFIASLGVERSTAFADSIYLCQSPDGTQTFVNGKVRKPKGSRCRLYMKGTKSGASGDSGRASNASGSSSLYARSSNGSRSLPPTPSGTDAAHPKDGSLPFGEFVDAAADEYALPAELIHAVIRVESSYRVDAISRAGAQGLMQLMPTTAERMGVDEPFDARANIFGGAKYLRRLANYFEGDIIKVLAAYHAGHRAVVESDGIPYAATERYVKKVLGHYFELKSDSERADRSD